MDLNCVLDVEIDGASVAKNKEVVLRICDPVIECRVLIRDVPVGAKGIKATLTIGGDDVKTKELVLSGEDVMMNSICAIETISSMQSETFSDVASALAARDFKKALAVNESGLNGIKELFKEQESQQIQEALNSVIKDFEDQIQSITQSQEDHRAARETELRAMSRSSTVRNGGISIDPMMTRSLSELQSQLSEA